MIPTPREGIIVALWTPTDERGQLLTRELEANLDFIRARNVHGIMPLGSTGEFVHFDTAQRKEILELVTRRVSPLPIIANISNVRLAVVTELATHARQIGCAAVTALPPWFFALAQADLVEFFVRAGEMAQLPLFLYNFPERTGQRISLETVAAVAARVPLAGVKQSGAEFSYHRELVQLGREKNFVVLTGADTRLAEAMALGVTGCVSGLANVVPEVVLEIFHAVKAGTPAQAADAIRIMSAFGGLMDKLEFPLNVSAAMAARGRHVGLPKSIVSPATQARYQALIAEVRQLLNEWKLT
ncbi:MAG: dihydrodipicolinate synthase family protein [Verrucomicrobia bacterium]|nr:dihydrodipicolinate synthase family protein [Verrucomicrobiota bacterium]